VTRSSGLITGGVGRNLPSDRLSLPIDIRHLVMPVIPGDSSERRFTFRRILNRYLANRAKKLINLGRGEGSVGLSIPPLSTTLVQIVSPQ
jgi:hypothetical protein